MTAANLTMDKEKGLEMDKPTVFVIMPFSEEFFEAYEMLKVHFYESFEFSHAGEEDNQQNILADIMLPIYSADIVLADLTGLNPNVMYELGIAHSFNKKTIVITRDSLDSLPFDLKQYRAKNYSTHFKSFFELVSYLEKNLNGAIEGNVVFNNPVGDFLESNHLNPDELFKREPIAIEIDGEEKGFVDFLAEIEEDTDLLVDDINKMSSELDSMNTGIDNCTKEINRANKSGGNGTASFVRKQTKKAAEHIAKFSQQLKMHNESITSYWTRIEKNIIGLLENDISARPENKESLIDYMKSLRALQESLSISDASVSELKEASLKNIGIERSLNQSIRFLDADLASYLAMTNQMNKSIDRIVDKSKFVIGDVLL